MYNTESELFNGALLGSSGSVKFVRLSSSVTCEAITTRALLSSADKPFRLVGFAEAVATTPLLRVLQFQLVGQATASAISRLSGNFPVLVQLFGSVVAAGQIAVQRRRLVRVSASGLVSAVGAMKTVGMLKLFPAGVGAAESTARLYILKHVPLLGEGVATGTLGFANRDAVPERTMNVEASDRLMRVAGGR
jgi:hypothetical protein